MWKESETLELKSSIPLEDILETICAFANTKGGVIYLGINDDGDVKGISIGANTIENLANKVTRDLDPNVSGISIEPIKIDEKNVIRITVPESQTKPHFYGRRAYLRLGKTNQTFSPSQLEALYIKKVTGMHGMDTKILEEATLEDVDEESLKRYANEAGVEYHDKKHALRSLGLMKDGKIFAGAILFFGKSPEIFFPLYGTKCALMAGEEIVEMNDFRESIFVAVDRVVNYVMKNIPHAYKIEGTRRVEIPRIPNDVVREAVVNAMIHRDYSMGSSIFVRLGKDTLKIKNPGVLPPSISIDDLFKEHHSDPRNKLLAELAHKVHLIEHWGTGTTKIIREMRKHGLEDPVFREDKGYFEVLLSMKEPILNERQKKLLLQLKKKEMDIRTILENADASERSIRNDLAALERTGFVRKTRKGRKYYYYI